jgi:hypothetical protein
VEESEKLNKTTPHTQTPTRKHSVLFIFYSGKELAEIGTGI